jgi:hypothetical protein
VAVGGCSVIESTADFTAWTKRTAPVSDSFTGAAYSGSTFAVSGNGTVITSTDGTTWSSHAAGSQNKAIIWTSSGFMMVGSQIPGGTTTPVGMATIGNANGATWSIPTEPSVNRLNGVAYSGSLFVVVGEGGAIATSPTGFTWTARSSGTTQKLNGIAWSGTKFVAVGAHGTAVSSSDGITWTAGVAP